MDYVSLFSTNFATLVAIFIIPAVGIITLVVLARALGFDADPLLGSRDEAAGLAHDALIGFAPADVAIDADARAALVSARDGRVALIRPHGDRWVVRVANGADASVTGDTLTVCIAEPAFTPVALRLGKDAPRWAQRLAA
jgi:hypothetical protein